MKTKIFIIIILLFIFSLSNVYAVNILLNNTSSNDAQISNEIIMNDSKYEEHEDYTTSNPAPTVTHTSTSSSDTDLSISDIIDIILIAVCIVLIFLAIAILIRCK